MRVAAIRDQLSRQGREPGSSHHEDKSVSRRNGRLSAVRGMSGDNCERTGYAAGGDGNPGRSRPRNGAADAGDDFYVHSGLAAGLDLLTPAPKDKRIATLEPDNGLPLERVLHQQRI